MKNDGQGRDATAVNRGAAGEGLPPLCRDALQLHGFRLSQSIKEGHPGFVSDDYLHDMPAEVAAAAAELEAAGLWERCAGGYAVVPEKMLKIVLGISESEQA